MACPSDQFWLKGVDSTIGYVASADKPAAEDSTVVQLLRDSGAVFYAKSNVPTTLTSGETVNGLFGRTVNPRNRTLSPGGSSGGEAALVTFRASFLGVGTDIGGSVRHPCSFTGLYGLRPSHGRVPHRRVPTTYAAGQTDVLRPSVGPLCRSPDDVRLFMATLAALQPWRLDPLCLHLPWRVDQERLPPRLCFGLSYGDGVVAPTPPLRRALDMVRARLLAAGHGVIEHTAHEIREADEIIGRMSWTAEGNGGDEFPRRGADRPGELSMSSSSSSGAAGLKGGGWFGAGAGGLTAPPTQVVRAQTVSETWQNQQARSLLFRKWSDRWERTAARPGANGRVMDALIMPSTPFPAVRHERGLPWHYGQLSPLLDLTTGVFPVTKVDLVKDVVPPDWRPISDKDLEVMKFCGWEAGKSRKRTSRTSLNGAEARGGKSDGHAEGDGAGCGCGLLTLTRGSLVFVLDGIRHPLVFLLSSARGAFNRQRENSLWAHANAVHQKAIAPSGCPTGAWTCWSISRISGQAVCPPEHA
ncbi:hypothetical protein RB595_008257 [Gaeumannomyces hyphopodioides]